MPTVLHFNVPETQSAEGDGVSGSETSEELEEGEASLPATKVAGLTRCVTSRILGLYGEVNGKTVTVPWKCHKKHESRAFIINNGVSRQVSKLFRRREDALSAACERRSDCDPEGDGIWAGMVRELAESNGPIPKSLGKAGEEIAELRKERIRREKESKKTKPAWGLSGAEKEARRAELRANRKKDRASAEKRTVTGTNPILSSIRMRFREDSELTAVFDYCVLPKKEREDCGKPPIGDATRFLSELNGWVRSMMLANNRKISTAVVSHFAELKVRLLVSYPQIPDPARDFLGLPEASWTGMGTADARPGSEAF